MMSAAMLTAMMCVAAQAERICDVRSQPLSDGDMITIKGRIVSSPSGRDDNGDYEYEIEDSCGLAVVTSRARIQCNGTVTISGSYDEEYSDYLEVFEEGDVALTATHVTCR